MKNQKLIEQIRIALQILEGDLPYDARVSSGLPWEPTRKPADGYHLTMCLQGGHPIRIAPQPVRVPLGPEDVPPGSAFRQRHYHPGVFVSNLAQNKDGITAANNDQELELICWATLMSLYEIKRPGEDWQACSKPALESPTSEQP